MDALALLKRIRNEGHTKVTAPPSRAASHQPPPPNMSEASVKHWTLMTLPLDLVLYAREIVTPGYETNILAWGAAMTLSNSWTALRHRRLLSLTRDSWPTWLHQLAVQLTDAGIFPATQLPNHALINHYEPGEGILAHTDGPGYAPVTATISFGSPALMHFSERRNDTNTPIAEVLLEPRSLLVFKSKAYTHMLHAIDEVTVERVGDTATCINADLAEISEGSEVRRHTFRISVTFRHALPSTTLPVSA